MRKLIPYIACAATVILLAACAKAPVKKQPAPVKPAVTRGWWVLTGVEDSLPPMVDTRGLNPLAMQGKNDPGYVNPFPAGTHEHFAADKAYPVTPKVFSDERLLSLVTVTNAKIIICLPQQRARLYVYGRVAMDWPVSTGVNGHTTPTGVFRIIEKSRDHHSSRYGRWLVDGKVVDSNADNTREAPEGATFSPSGMPNWNRLTWDGVGIHGGRVVPGRRLSHGCIRTPFATARKLFEHTLLGMPVYISPVVEDYNRGGYLTPEDVKYRPEGDGAYTAAASRA